ncbi:MAG: aldehyde-activating protein [Bauldia sp.]|nr:MAG: aldehyde-activating protein [Bauldia sp.]
MSATLTLTKPASEIELRACQCGFCARHGAATVSDPQGHAEIRIEHSAWHVYQFALRSAEPLVCANCGVYVGTVLREGKSAWSVVNVRGMGMTEFDPARAQSVHYDSETLEGRIARRKARWTPTEISLAPSSSGSKKL